MSIKQYFVEHDRGFLLSLVIVVLAIYLPFLGNQFIFDDLVFFNHTIEDYKNSSSSFSPRSITYASLTWTWSLFGDLPHAHRLLNLFLHTTCVLLLFCWLRQLILLTWTAEKLNNDILSLKWGAWLGALFFASTPVATYAVGYLLQRSILLATVFTLAMQVSYLSGLIDKEKIAQRRGLALSVLFFLLAVLSKEHSVMAPLIVLATTVIIRTKVMADNLTLWATWMGYVAVALYITWSVKGVTGVIYELDAPQLLKNLEINNNHVSNLHFLSAITQAGLFFKYIFLWLLPNPAWMSIDMREQFFQSTTLQALVSAIGFMVYGLIALWLLLKQGQIKLVGLALLYPWLFFLVEFSTVRVQEPFVLYRSYLWFPGMMLLFVFVLRIFPNRKYVVLTLFLLILAIVPMSWNRLWVLADNYRLWNDAALLLRSENTSGAARIYYNRGNAELNAHKWKEAITDYQRSITLNPSIAQTHKNIAVAYFGLQNYREAIKEFDYAIELKSDYAEAYFGKAITLKRLKKDSEAQVNIRKSCEHGYASACFLIQSQ